MKLIDPTWEELNRAFFEYVAKGHLTQVDKECQRTLERDIRDVYGDDRSANGNSTFIPPYSHRADVVLPWLQKVVDDYGYWRVTSNSVGISVVIDAKQGPVSDSFPHAAVLVLLAHHGVEVTFTKGSG